MDISLNHKLAQIQTELKVHKSQFNKYGNYYYRSAEDFTEALKPFLLPHDVTVTLKEKYLGDHVIKSTAIISDGVQRIKATAIVQVDMDSKVNMSIPQRYGTASSYGKKYALGNLFLVDDTQDDDATNKNKKPLIKGTLLYKQVVEALKDGSRTLDKIKETLIISEELEVELNKL
tara:strand:- start:1170 stop:1694 length:525 start_codon:yes stop_codon:yes gene_type:complete